MIGKAAAIDRDPRQRFFYVPLPEALKNRFTEMAKQYEGAVEVDHVTLLYVPKAAEPVSTDAVTKVVSAAEAVGKEQAPIHAKVQGWAYFDGAKKDGKDVTALVALLDAPGLEDLHVALKAAMRKEGVETSEDHGFNPHCTFAYLPHGRRVDDLPLLDGAFTVDKFCFVNREIHEVKLTGSLGEQAVKAATDLRSQVMQALGEASMCWEPRPTGVFDADAAARIGERLLSKTADHEHDRARERSKIDPAYLRDLEAFLHDKRLPRIPLHMALPDGSSVALSPAGKRHVVSTVLAPGMKPKGVPLSSVLHRGKPPAPRLRKEAVDFQALWHAVGHRPEG